MSSYKQHNTLVFIDIYICIKSIKQRNNKKRNDKHQIQVIESRIQDFGGIHRGLHGTCNGFFLKIGKKKKKIGCSLYSAYFCMITLIINT